MKNIKDKISTDALKIIYCALFLAIPVILVAAIIGIVGVCK